MLTSWIPGVIGFFIFHVTNHFYPLEKGASLRIYYDYENLKINKAKILGPLARALCGLIGMLVMIVTFYYISLYNPEFNTGIIVSLFATSMIWSAAIFFCFY